MIAVSLNVGGGVGLIKPAKLYMCTQNTTNTKRTDTAEPHGKNRYEKWNTCTLVKYHSKLLTAVKDWLANIKQMKRPWVSNKKNIEKSFGHFGWQLKWPTLDIIYLNKVIKYNFHLWIFVYLPIWLEPGKALVFYGVICHFFKHIFLPLYYRLYDLVCAYWPKFNYQTWRLNCFS